MEGIGCTILVEERAHYIAVDAAINILFTWICAFRQPCWHILSSAKKNVAGTPWDDRVWNAARSKRLECKSIHLFSSLACQNPLTAFEFCGRLFASRRS